MTSEFKLKLKWRLLLPAGDKCKFNAVNRELQYFARTKEFHIYLQWLSMFHGVIFIIYPPYDDIENICYGKSKFSPTFITDESKHCKYLQIKDHHCNNCVCNYVYLKNSVSLPNNSLSWPRVRDISANNDTDQSGWRRTSSYIVTDPQLVHQQRGEVARVRGVEHDLATLADALPP